MKFIFNKNIILLSWQKLLNTNYDENINKKCIVQQNILINVMEMDSNLFANKILNN